MTVIKAPSPTLASNERRVQELLNEPWQLLIGGELVDSSSGATFDVVSPYTLKVIARVPDGTAADAERAVAAALEAFPRWAELTPVKRGEHLLRLAEAIDAVAFDLALLDAVDAGAPVNVVAADVRAATAALRYFAGLALEMKGESVPASTNLHFTMRQPFGVVARITPFNHPILFAVSRIAAPLVAGNTVVLKPSEATPLSALALGKIVRDILPPGVVSIVVGNGLVVPEVLVRHPDVYRIGFTGSEGAGRAIQRTAAEVAVKHITLELGGKNALVAFPDADPNQVASAAIAGMNFWWSGQSCGSTSRLVVYESIADAVVARAAELVQNRKFLSPLDPAATQGTIASQQHYDRVLEFLSGAQDDGAVVIAGGGAPQCDGPGLFIEPTILDHVRRDSRIACEEVFGPVLTVLRWDGDDDPVAIANSVRYGLTGSVFTNDVRRAHRVARDLQTGYVWINGVGAHFTGMPFGGWKNSGLGSEESLDELLSYTQVKSVNVML